MKLAENKFKMLVEDGIWQSPDDKDERLIALEAQVKQLKNQRGKVTPKGEVKINKPKGKEIKNKSKDRPAWLTVPPKAGEPRKKMVDGDSKPWYWCPKHEAWVRHTPQECKGKEFQPKTQASKKDIKDTKTKAKETLTVSKALTAIMEADDDSV